MNDHDKYLVLRVLASATRFKIMKVLAKHKQIDVTGIKDALGMTHSAVSHQLAQMSGYKVVEAKKAGRRMVYKFASGPAGSYARKIMRA